MKIITESPSWFIIFCLLTGAFFAWLLYRNDTTYDGIHPWLKRLLMSLRFLFLTLLAFLLLTPLIQTLTRQTEKPIIIVAQDNSQSVVIKDSTFYRNEYAQKMRSLINDLNKKYDVKEVSFGDKVKDGIDFSYTDKQTDYTRLMNELDARYANRNVGAVIFASDGLYNSGSNPVYYSGSVNAPVYTVALGDTTARKDLRIGNIRFNKIVYLNSTFPLEVIVDAQQCSGENTTLTVEEEAPPPPEGGSNNAQALFSKTLKIPANKFQQMVPVYLDAKKKGIHHYRVSVSEVTGEITIANNVKDVYVEVQESKRKVLIVADSPHPDLAALKEAIESSENYEIKTQLIGKFDAKLNEYQAIILHQLPSDDHQATEVIQKIKQAAVPVWFVVGSQTNINAFNALSSGISIKNSIGKLNDVLPVVSSDFNLFTISEETKNSIRLFPPLLVPFGEYNKEAGGSSLLVQKIGAVETEQPLLFLKESGETRSVVLCGEDIWRWRLHDYQLNGNFNSFNEIVSKVIQFLSVRENKSHFKVVSRNSFPENEPVVIDAEVYNDNFELVNTPDISITITSKDGKAFPFTFSKTERAYTLNAGLFAPGNYHYKATVKIGEKQYSKEGEFSVNALQVEQTETTADHQLLFSLSKKTGGQMFYPGQLNELEKLLESKEDIKTVSYSQMKLVDIVNLKWFFFFLLVLISIEWFVRKRSGGY